MQDFSFSLADEDFSSQVNEIASLDPAPQVLFTAMVMPQTQTLLEQLDAAGLGDVVVIGVDGFDATVVWSAGEVADGVFFAAHTFPTDDNDVQAFLDDAAAAGAEIETISFGALAADAVQILAAAADGRLLGRRRHADLHDRRISELPVTTGIGHLRRHQRRAREGRRHPHRHGRRAGLRRDAATDVHPRLSRDREAARGRWPHHALRRDHGAARRVALVSTPVRSSPSSVRTAPARRHC